MSKLLFRIGQSRDIHRLEENGRTLILGGVKLPFYKGPVSHSDGDCLYHAIGEAILGALAKGDLGKLFPDNDPKYKDFDSSLIIKEIVKIMKEEGYEVCNIDASIIIEKPKLAPYIVEMRKNVASLLECEINEVSIKAQTNEKCGEVGREEAVECQAIVLLQKI
ncbi:MAG: 2-C-methyl-D-erythritol 2,4-cyclodiphosphate synthase [Bacilli bacterium]